MKAPGFPTPAGNGRPAGTVAPGGSSRSSTSGVSLSWSPRSLCVTLRRSLPSLTQSVAPVHRPGGLRCGESWPLVCSLCRLTIPSQSSQCYFCACSSV